MRWSVIIACVGFAVLAAPAAAEQAQYEGVKVCAKCHDLQADSWKKTVHAKALESLKPNVKAEQKTKAKLDPAKDYSADDKCVGCHVTGFGQPGGYAVGMPAAQAAALGAVGCESCHGAGSLFRHKHGDAENKLKKDSERTPRALLVTAGQNFDYRAACAGCHENVEGAHGAKPPFTPFTSAVDPKYAFDFDKAVRGNGIHTHYKLTGAFTGEPEPPLRAEFQKTAKDLE